MLRLLFVFILSVLFQFSALGQDLILRITGDTIHCKIDKTDEAFVYYRTLKTKKGRSELISTKEVMRLVYSAELGDTRLPETINTKPYPKVKLFGAFGFSRILSSEDIEDPDISQYYSELRWGLALDIGANLQINQEWGVGFLYGRSTYSNRIGPVLYTPSSGGAGSVGDLSDDITINYYAANATYRLEKDQSNYAFEVSFGLGYTSYSNRSEIVFPLNYQAWGLGVHANGSFELGLGQGFYIPIRAGFKGFNVGDIETSFPEDVPAEFLQDILFSLEQNPSIDVLRFEMSIGLSLIF